MVVVLTMPGNNIRSQKSRKMRVLDTLTRNNERRTAAITDVTLNDYANSEVKLNINSSSSSSSSSSSVRRMKKKNNITTAMKKLTMQTGNDEKPWDEQDSEEENIISNAGIDSEGTMQMRRDHKRRRRRIYEKTGGGEEEEHERTANYPLDLWFLISEHIRPEDVGRFASICQATYYVTTTARFWLAMYRRYYHWSAALPDSLNYWNLDHTVRNMRMCVVRALFLMYAPFCGRIAAEKPLSADPTQLLRAQCILQWHQKDGLQHKYFFMFAHPELKGRVKRLTTRVGDSSAYSNPHNGCWVLEATCVSTCAVPMVMGEYLYHAGIGVSANLCSHTLRLSLVPAHLLPPSATAPTPRYRVPATEITLDPVRNVRVYAWWHPQYWNALQPHHHTGKT